VIDAQVEAHREMYDRFVAEWVGVLEAASDVAADGPKKARGALNQRELFFVPETPASMVPNTVTPLPPVGVAALDALALPAEPVPAQPATSAPIATARTAAMNGFTGNSKRCGGS